MHQRVPMGHIASRYQDLSFEQLKTYYLQSPWTWPDQFATQLELLTEDGRYNYAAYLLSDHNGLSLQVAKYSGSDRLHLQESQEHGYASIVQASKTVLTQLQHETMPQLHATALHEVVMNAIVHNDYRYEVPPKFELFSDRLEITSAGGIPQGLNDKDMLQGYSVPQNKELMRVFRELGMVQQLGAGIPRLLAHYPHTIYHFIAHFIRVTLPYPARVKAPSRKLESKTEPALTPQAIPPNPLTRKAKNRHNPSPPTPTYNQPETPENSTPWGDRPHDKMDNPQGLEETELARKVKDLLSDTPQDREVENLSPHAERVLAFCRQAKGRVEIQEHLGLKDREYFRKRILIPLIDAGHLQLTLPDKPTSPKQQFITVRR